VYQATHYENRENILHFIALMLLHTDSRHNHPNVLLQILYMTWLYVQMSGNVTSRHVNQFLSVIKQSGLTLILKSQNVQKPKYSLAAAFVFRRKTRGPR